MAVSSLFFDTYFPDLCCAFCNENAIDGDAFVYLGENFADEFIQKQCIAKSFAPATFVHPRCIMGPNEYVTLRQKSELLKNSQYQCFVEFYSWLKSKNHENYENYHLASEVDSVPFFADVFMFFMWEINDKILMYSKLKNIFIYKDTIFFMIKRIAIFYTSGASQKFMAETFFQFLFRYEAMTLFLFLDKVQTDTASDKIQPKKFFPIFDGIFSWLYLFFQQPLHAKCINTIINYCKVYNIKLARNYAKKLLKFITDSKHSSQTTYLLNEAKKQNIFLGDSFELLKKQDIWKCYSDDQLQKIACFCSKENNRHFLFFILSKISSLTSLAFACNALQFSNDDLYELSQKSPLGNRVFGIRYLSPDDVSTACNSVDLDNINFH